MFKEELLNIIRGWTLEQLNNYINQLETRITDTHALLKELKIIRRKKSKKFYDTGTRGGMG